MLNNPVIMPYIGVGKIKFGMTRNEIYESIGYPTRKKKPSPLNEFTEYWFENGLQLTFNYPSGALAEISIYPNIKNVTLNELSIFEEDGKAVYKSLCDYDGDPRETVGITVFFKLGLAITGFLDGDEDQKSITAFADGVWDKHDPSLIRVVKM